MNGVSSLADTSLAMTGFIEMTFVIAGFIFVLYGIFNFGVMIFRTNIHPDDYMGYMFRSMLGIVMGGIFIGSNMNSDTLGVLKYVGIGICCLVVAGIVGGITMFFLGIKKYKNYIKKTNELLLLKDDFLVLSSHLQTIEDQILLNSKMVEELNNKKKEELTFLNSLLTEKRFRFNGMIADIRSSISL